MYYADFNTAVNVNLTTGRTIYPVRDDVNLTPTSTVSNITANNTVTLDLDGHNVKMAYNLPIYGTLNIINTSINKATVTQVPYSGSYYQSYALTTYTNGTLNINNVDIRKQNDAASFDSNRPINSNGYVNIENSMVS